MISVTLKDVIPKSIRILEPGMTALSVRYYVDYRGFSLKAHINQLPTMKDFETQKERDLDATTRKSLMKCPDLTTRSFANYSRA
jgi:hypothetical protein